MPKIDVSEAFYDRLEKMRMKLEAVFYDECEINSERTLEVILDLAESFPESRLDNQRNWAQISVWQHEDAIAGHREFRDSDDKWQNF